MNLPPTVEDVCVLKNVLLDVFEPSCEAAKSTAALGQRDELDAPLGLTTKGPFCAQAREAVQPEQRETAAGCMRHEKVTDMSPIM